MADLKAAAQTLRENCEVVVVAGIGGSYLGARAVIEALSDSFAWLKEKKAGNPTIIFAGHNISEDYLYELTTFLKDKKVRRNQYFQVRNHHRNGSGFPPAEKTVRRAARKGNGTQGNRSRY